MSIGPLLPGRLPNSLAFSRLQSNISQNSLALQRLEEQLATGKKFFLPSESPSAAIKTHLLQSSLERQTQLKANVSTDRSLLGATEESLATVSNAINSAKSIVLAGVGNSISGSEKAVLATEVDNLIQQIVIAGNTKFRGRYLFAGSQTGSIPFEVSSDGNVRYNGDRQSIQSFVETDKLFANNVNGVDALGALSSPVTSDINPALTLDTKVSDLLGGRGVALGSVVVTVDNGGANQQTIDLSPAESIGDIKAIIENAFGGAVTVDIDPATKSGIRLTATAGTVAVSNVANSHVATDLGIAGGPAASIQGNDLDPKLTRLTKLSALNGGNGIGPTAGHGLLITNGSKTAAIDISAATTVEDLFNTIQAANIDVELGINEAGNGLSVVTRLSGANFSIGENGGLNATALGIRTLNADTALSDLNFGRGVPVDGGQKLEIVRRDGSTLSVDLSDAQSVQDVLDALNAEPNLSASLNAVGNGITILDNSGTGPLTVQSNAISIALGIDGADPGTDPSVPLVGKDVNPQEAGGVLNILRRLSDALRTGDDNELQRLDGLINDEVIRVNDVRGEVGSRLKLLDEVENRLLDTDLALTQSLQLESEIDVAEVLTQVVQMQQVIEATFRIASTSVQLSLIDFL